MRLPVAALCLALSALSSPAAVIVVANYTPNEVVFTLGEPGLKPDAKPRQHTLPAYHVAPFVVSGPADLVAPAGGKVPAVRVDPYHAYAFLPEPDAGLRVEMLELPGQPPDADAKPEAVPQVRDPVKIPVTLHVDDADPRADEVWQKEVRKRFDSAAVILEAQTGFRLEFAGYGTWKSAPDEPRLEDQLTAFEGSAKPKAGGIAIGFVSRKVEDGPDSAVGWSRPRGGSHVVVREWRPKGEPERVEVLLCHLAATLGAVPSPDPGSAMRARLGDGQALHPRFVIRLDPLNVLALNLWADQRRAGRADTAAVPQPDRTRLLRVYKAMLQASPGDGRATEYVRELELNAGKRPDSGNQRPPSGPLDREKRLEATRAVVAAVARRAKANTGADAITGDALTAELMRVAADAALAAGENDRVPAFLVGLGVALDDTDALRDNPVTRDRVRDVETDHERNERVKVLGNPTLKNRRDLCRRFAIGCATGELLTPTAAEDFGVSAARLSLHKPSGFSLPCVAAEFAGVAFARRIGEQPALLPRLRDPFRPAELLPNLDGLRDAVGSEKFAEWFGSTGDERFRLVLEDVRKRTKSLPVIPLKP